MQAVKLTIYNKSVAILAVFYMENSYNIELKIENKQYHDIYSTFNFCDIFIQKLLILLKDEKFFR